jgi:DNA-binding MarR family transcriptional regulator
MIEALQALYEISTQVREDPAQREPAHLLAESIIDAEDLPQELKQTATNLIRAIDSLEEEDHYARVKDEEWERRHALKADDYLQRIATHAKQEGLVP